MPSLRANDYDAYNDEAMKDVADCERGACSVTPPRLRCFSADWIKSNQNAFHDPQAKVYKKLSTF